MASETEIFCQGSFKRPAAEEGKSPAAEEAKRPAAEQGASSSGGSPANSARDRNKVYHFNKMFEDLSEPVKKRWEDRVFVERH